MNEATFRVPIAIAMVAAWLVGSIPTAYLVGKANGVDLRTVGSGNLGATNVQRTLGWGWGLFVYAVDVLKGALPVFVFPTVVGMARGWPWGVALGVAAIVGHVRPVFLLGKGGGKGVATASGVFLALAPLATAAALIGFLITVLSTRYVSLGSLVGATVLPVAMLIEARALTPLIAVSLIISVFVFYTHRQNIARLRAGTERRVGASQRA
jgi:glycerol-3-phosphate acyltransferase PlsY